jgi:pimeloyl-ACP methyl ester carboxylesterase
MRKISSRHIPGHSSCRDKRHKQDLYISSAARRPSPEEYHAWQGWADALKDKRRVIRFDLPGFGLTGPSPDRDYSLDKDVALVFAVLDKLGVERCILGGNSLGGSVSLNAALTNPARVEKLILVDSGGYPLNPSSAPAGFLVAHIAAQVPWMGWLLKNTVPRSLVEQGMRNVFGDPSKVTPEMVGRAVALTQREGNRQALLDRFRQRRPGSLANRKRNVIGAALAA